MNVKTVSVTPFPDQKPGTSGLRKKVREFQQPNYLESFVQAVFDSGAFEGDTLVLGGDGRFWNTEALQIIIRMAAANGIAGLIVGRNGLLSTPAASHLIRVRRAAGGIILSASHNPGGPDGDFGVKVNGPNGAPAPERITDAVYRQTKTVTAYRIVEGGAVDLSRLGEQLVADTRIEVVDPAADYADLMQTLFDFDRIRELLRSRDFRIVFDAMNAITGPYAREILETRLGAPAGTVIRGEPLPDFGGAHPDPNAQNARELVAAMGQAGAQFGAACDGDGDRHLVVGRGFFVTPSDSLAILAANAHLAPGYARGLAGVARSMPTSRAVDRVADSLNLPCYETPTGWKYFGSLLDAGMITLCGEESAGAGSDHVREKDGLWAVLFWLNIVAARRQAPPELVQDHWRRFGRHAYARYDYEEIDSAAANALIETLRSRLGELPGTRLGGRVIEACDDFSYTDPVDGSIAAGQGLRFMLSGEGRVVMRLSGTGTAGATLRVYLEQYLTDGNGVAEEALHALGRLAAELAQVAAFTGRTAPSHIV